MTLKGIDVSYAQGNVNWSQVKSSGIQFAVLRAGFGREVSQKDKYFEQNYMACKSVGIPVGVYHYSYAQSVSEARTEAKACISWLAGKTLEYPVFYDLEDGSMTHLGKSTLTQIALAFCDEMQKSGYRVGIYANKNWLVNYLDMSQLNQYPVWLAQYNNQITYNGKVDMWQYTSTGRVPGISGNVDMNECYTVLYGKPGWIQQEGKWWYRHADGSYTKNGWEKISGEWYYFDKNGWMKTGWIQYKGGWYCCADNGKMYHDTWKLLGGKWYVFDANGKAHEGWYHSSDNRWYYLKPETCEMLKGWLEVDGRWYYLSPKASENLKEGEMVKGKQTIDGKVYRFAEKTEGNVKEGQMIA
ncbi:MAG: GH25 family lysozyme [Massiliimalia sp.]|jgi:GH25 family lysozyme M1 (1,4-beta-N-acetylmuramidase)